MMRKNGILLIHGILGSPREYEPLEPILQAAGFSTGTVALPGHGDAPGKPLHRVTAQEMLDHCLAEYTAFSEKCDDIIIVGHSLGGICSLLTAARRPEKLRGVIALSSPFEEAYTVNSSHKLLGVPLKTFFPSVKYLPDQLFKNHRRPMFYPWTFPFLRREADIIFTHARQSLQHIDVPVCLAHSPYDITVPYTEMDKIARAINKPHQVTTHTLERCGHQIFPKSNERERVTELILEFCRSQLAIENLSIQ